MTELRLSMGEPFTSPAWGSNFVVFTETGVIPEEDAKEYLRKVCKYAKGYGVYLVPQRFMLMGFCCLCLISPEGRVLGAQRGIYQNAAARVGRHGAALDVFSTEFGGVFLCLDVDLYHPEVCRIAQGMGADYVVCAQTIAPEDYGSSMVFTGAWNAAQACGVYVVDTCNQFHCVCAPLALTKHGDGFITSPSLRTPMTAKLQADLLRTLPQPFRLSRKFYAIHRGDLLG